MSHKDDDLTVSKIYGVLKSPSFLQKLYWDTLSVIKREETYREVRGLAERLIDQKMETLENLGDNDSDNIRRKTTVAEISSMCYAIDTVYSKILFMKLCRAVKSLIPVIVSELRNEGKIPDDVWLAISESHRSTNDANAVVTDMLKSAIHNEPSTSSGIKRTVTSTNVVNGGASGTNCKNVTSNDIPVRKRGRPRKKLGGRIQAFPKKNVSEPVTSTPKKPSTKENDPTVPSVSLEIETNHVDLAKDSMETGNQGESDAESIVSVGHVSIASVSSVHTSDLSSFDDEISLSSDEEGGKKRKLSIKDLQKKFSHREKISSASPRKVRNADQIKSPLKVSAVDGVSNSAESQKKISLNEELSLLENIDSAEQMKTPLKVSAVEAVDNSPVAVSQSPEMTGTSKRIRKPNSKYSSDIVFPVKVKERRKSNESAKINNEKNSLRDLSPKAKKIKTNNENVETSSVTQKVDIPLNNTNSSVNHTPKQSDLLHKSQTTLPSLTSRKTAPLTLFSTGT